MRTLAAPRIGRSAASMPTANAASACAPTVLPLTTSDGKSVSVISPMRAAAGGVSATAIAPPARAITRDSPRINRAT